MTTVPPNIKKYMIYDEAVLKERWDLCSSCEFLTDSNSCKKCGCFMKVKHKLAHASCPIGKWDKYIPEIVEKSNKFGTPVSDLIKAKKEEIAMEQNNS